MSIITVDAVSKSYRGHTLYRDVSFGIEEGSITSVTGPNGAGKSVLFRLLCGFLAPDAGQITIDPRYLTPGRTFPDRFGVIIDRPGYLAGRTGLDNLRELAAIRNQISDAKIKDTMNSLGLDPDLKQKVRHYSLGMKQKLALAQALMEGPDVLVLDEPFNALDAESVSRVRQIFTDLNAAGVTILFTSHNAQDVDALSTHRLAIMNGTIVPA